MENISWSASSKRLFSVRKTKTKEVSPRKKVDHKARIIRRRREDLEDEMAIKKEFEL